MAPQEEVNCCKFFARGFVALLSSGSMIAVDDLDQPRPRTMPSLPASLVEDVASLTWAVMAPQFTLSRTVECLISNEKTILLVDNSDVQDQLLDQGPFSHIESSPNGRFLALRSFDGKIRVTSSDFQRTLSEYDASIYNSPIQMVWCGNDSVVLSFESLALVIGPSEGSLQ